MKDTTIHGTWTRKDRCISYCSRKFHFVKRYQHNPFLTQVADGLFIGRAPIRDEDISILRRKHITAVISLLEVGEIEYVKQYKGVKHVLRLPTPDFISPNKSQIVEAVRFANTRIESGDSVFIHCKSGRGRSAICAVAYLSFKKKIPASQAHANISKVRNISSYSFFSIVKRNWRNVNDLSVTSTCEY